jgi:hypothetical protein
MVVVINVEPKPVSGQLPETIVDEGSQNLTADATAGFSDHNPLQFNTTIDRRQAPEDHVPSPLALLLHQVIEAVRISHLAFVHTRIVATHKAEAAELLFKLKQVGEVVQGRAAESHETPA